MHITCDDALHDMLGHYRYVSASVFGKKKNGVEVMRPLYMFITNYEELFYITVIVTIIASIIISINTETMIKSHYNVHQIVNRNIPIISSRRGITISKHESFPYGNRLEDFQLIKFTFASWRICSISLPDTPLHVSIINSSVNYILIREIIFEMI